MIRYADMDILMGPLQKETVDSQVCFPQNAI